MTVEQFLQHRPISIHALREEGDQFNDLAEDLCMAFLSTPSARRATQRDIIHAAVHQISIHALREEGDHGLQAGDVQVEISIHALREEGD